MRKNKRLLSGVLILAAMFLFFQQGSAADELPSDSTAARKLVETYIAGNASDNALELLTQIISSDSFKDIKDWAVIQYYGLSQNKGGIDAGVKKLEAIAGQADNVSLERGIAEGYVRLGDWAKVAGIYENLVKSNPDDPVLVTRLIDAYMFNKNYDAVIAILEPKVTANPDDVASSDILARAYVGAQRSDDAVALYKKKVAKYPNSPGLRGRYAQALVDLGMVEASLPEWNTAFQLDPRNLLFKQRIAESYMQLGNPVEAEKEYTELLNLIPDSQADFKNSIASTIKDIENTKKEVK